MFYLINFFGMKLFYEKWFFKCFVNIKCWTFSVLSLKVIVVELSGEKNSQKWVNSGIFCFSFVVYFLMLFDIFHWFWMEFDIISSSLNVLTVFSGFFRVLVGMVNGKTWEIDGKFYKTKTNAGCSDFFTFFDKEAGERSSHCIEKFC